MPPSRSSGLLLIVLLAGCSESKWIPPDQSCPGDLKPVWTANPAYSMCVGTSFRTTDLRTWRRAGAGSVTDLLSVQTDVGQIQRDLTGGWPPRLTAFDHGASARGHEPRTDSVGGIVFHTEIAARSPEESSSVITFISGFRTPDGRYMIANGQTASRATLDTLLLMFRTLTRAPSPDPSRRKP